MNAEEANAIAKDRPYFPVTQRLTIVKWHIKNRAENGYFHLEYDFGSVSKIIDGVPLFDEAYDVKKKVLESLENGGFVCQPMDKFERFYEISWKKD